MAGVGHVAGHGQHVVAQLAGHRVEVGGVAGVDDHLPAQFGQGAGQSPPQSLRSSGDDGAGHGDLPRSGVGMHPFKTSKRYLYSGPGRSVGGGGRWELSVRGPIRVRIRDGFDVGPGSAWLAWSAMADAQTRVDQALDQLLAELDPKSADDLELRGRQYDLGLAWVHFPEGWGGLDAPPNLQRTVDQRLRAAGAASPGARHFFGLALAGPTVVTHGSDEIKARLLRRMFTGEDAWCQLFSEPGAGSDLAGLSCRAVRDGDEWVVTGQKVWNTLAHIAERGMLVARTDPEAPKHKGLTYFAVDMHGPGRRGAPAAPDDRRGRVQRGVPDRGAHPRCRPHR